MSYLDSREATVDRFLAMIKQLEVDRAVELLIVSKQNTKLRREIRNLKAKIETLKTELETANHELLKQWVGNATQLP